MIRLLSIMQLLEVNEEMAIIIYRAAYSIFSFPFSKRKGISHGPCYSVELNMGHTSLAFLLGLLQ